MALQLHPIANSAIKIFHQIQLKLACVRTSALSARIA